MKDGAERIAHALAASANDALATSEAPRPLRLSASAAAGFVNFVRPDSRSDAVDTENPSAGADATRRGGRKKQRADKTPTGARENEAGKTLARGGRPGKEEQSLPQEGRWSAGGRLLGALGERMAAGDWEGEGWRSVFEGGAGRARDGKGPGFEIRMAPSAFDDEEYRLYCK